AATPPGKFELTSSEVQAGSNGVRLACDKLPLAVVSPWLKRFQPTWQLAGLATGETQITLPVSTGDEPLVLGVEVLTGTSSGRMTTTGLRLVAPSLLSEPLALQQADL